MTWVLASIILMVSSTTLYLGIRKSQDLSIPLEWRNFLMFGFPAALLLGYNFIQGTSFEIQPNHLLFLIGVAFFFSYLGNVFSLKSIENAPNPGYSLIISKSYVVLTTFLSALIFSSEITLKNIVAIFAIVLFSSLILYNEKVDTNKERKPWIAYTFGAFFGWSFLALSLYWLTSIQGMEPTIVVFYLLSIVTVFILIETFYKKISYKSLIANKSAIVTSVVIGVSALLFNLYIVIGYKLSPNPGYINAANTASIFLVTIMSWFLFKDELSFRKVVGIVGVLVGLVVLFI